MLMATSTRVRRVWRRERARSAVVSPSPLPPSHFQTHPSVRHSPSA
jgi:hypothetical protein